MEIKKWSEHTIEELLDEFYESVEYGKIEKSYIIQKEFERRCESPIVKAMKEYDYLSLCIDGTRKLVYYESEINKWLRYDKHAKEHEYETIDEAIDALLKDGE